MILIGGGLSLLIGLSVYLYYDAFHPLYRFRTMQDTIASTEQVDLRGLREINASGSSAPHFSDLQQKLGHLKQPKIIIDAKTESPGYIDGRPISFYRYDLSGPRPKHLIRRIYYTGSIFERRDLIVPAPEEAKKYGFDYASVHIGSRFIAPPEKIDEIVALLESIPPETWIHIHCRNGDGRTSMILTMLDIMRNAPTVTKDDIFKRQHLLGSVDFNDTVVWSKGASYSKKQLEDRKHFMENFYAFITQRKAGGIQLWSEWMREKDQKELES
jgi:hypothetical protein